MTKYDKIENDCSSNLAGVYPEGFQGEYTGLGTQLCMQLMKNNEKNSYQFKF